MAENAIYVRKGAAVGLPPSDSVAILANSSGDFRKLDSAGTESAFASGVASLAAGNSSVTVGGTAEDPTVAVATGARVTAAANRADLTFAPAGATDGGVEVQGLWVAGTGGDNDLIVQLNGATTGYTTMGTFQNDGDATARVWATNVNFGAGANTNGFSIARAGGAAGRDRVWFRVIIGPTVTGGPMIVTIEAGAFASADGTHFAIYRAEGIFIPAAALTSVAFVGDGGGDVILQNSYLVWRPRGLTA